MTEAAREIAILSLGQILATIEDEVENQRARETLDRHVRQVAAIVLDKPLNKPDHFTDELLSQVRNLILSGMEQSAPAA